MKEIWCDICGKKIGACVSMTCFGGEPNWNDFLVKQRITMDICGDCESEFANAVHETMKRLKSKKEKKA
jgi:hypothetical protein